MDETMNQNHEVNQTQQQTIGQHIKEAREKAQMSTKELSRATRIGVTMLELLEANELAQLPNRAYVNGYIKSCCKELGLNQAKALEVLEYTYHAQNCILEKKDCFETPMQRHQARRPNRAPEKKAAFSPAAKTATLVVIVITILVVYKFSNFNAPETTAIVAPATETKVETSSVSEQTPLLDSEKVEAATAPITATPVAKAAEVVAPKPEVKEVKKEEAKKEVTDGKKSKYETVAPVVLRPITQKLYGIKSTSPADLALVPLNYQQSVVQGKQNLYIIASKDDSWLTYKKDGDEIKALKLKKGHALFLTGDEFRLFFGNVNSTTIFLNNQLLDTPSSSGVKSVIIPESSNSKFKMPLFVYLKDGRIITSEQYEAN